MKLKCTRFLSLTLALSVVLTTQQAFAGEKYSYRHDAVELEGYVALPRDLKKGEKRPLILIVHQWKGISEHEMKQADRLAEVGYIAFAVDMYGKGIRPTANSEAREVSSIYKNDPARARARLHAALSAGKELTGVDSERIAVIGYCFGGGMALELARSGAPVALAVSFHGTLSTKQPAVAGMTKGTVLVHHGAADPFVPQQEVASLQQELTSAHVDWTVIQYASAVHSFTHQDAGSDSSKGVAYNPTADRRSWSTTLMYLREAFDKLGLMQAIKRNLHRLPQRPPYTDSTFGFGPQ